MGYAQELGLQSAAETELLSLVRFMEERMLDLTHPRLASAALSALERGDEAAIERIRDRALLVLEDESPDELAEHVRQSLSPYGWGEDDEDEDGAFWAD